MDGCIINDRVIVGAQHRSGFRVLMIKQKLLIATSIMVETKLENSSDRSLVTLVICVCVAHG
jgi:hypothetical protein